MPAPVLSLSSVSDGDAYFASKLYATIWTGADSDSKQNSLNEATRILNLFNYLGTLTSLDQPNAWPRTGVYLDRVLLDSTQIPSQILEAQYEIAFALLKGYDPEKDARNAGVTSRAFSSVRVAYDPRQTPLYLQWGVPSARAWFLILPFLDWGASGDITLHRVS